jgi:hypothetical protein
MFLACDFCPNVRLNTSAFGSQMESRRSVNAITIEQRHGGHMKGGAGRNQVLRQSSAFEKAESGTRVKLDVH